VKLEQKLDDHIVSQASDMSEIKTGITRIETKLDVKADKDELAKVITATNAKADRDEFLYWRNLLVSGILVSILLMLISIALSILFRG
jgi:hypothetical protein